MMKDIKMPFFVFFATSLILLVGCKSDLDGYEASNVLLSVDSKSIEFSDEVKSVSYPIKSTGSWEVTDIPVFLTFSQISGTGNAIINIAASDNPSSTDPREGLFYIHLSGITPFEIKVKQKPGKYIFEVTPKFPNPITFGPKENGEKSVNIHSNTSWSITHDFDWCHVKDYSGIGDKTISVYCDNNTTSKDRYDTLQIKTNYEVKYVPIFQSGSTYYIVTSVPRMNYSVEGGSQAFTVQTNVTDYTVRPKNGIASVVQDASNKSNYIVSIGRNTTAETRFDTIYITAVNIPNVKDSVLISQIGLDPVLEIKPDSLSTKPLQFGSNSSTGSFSIESNLNWELTCECEEGDWCRIISSKTGTGNGTVTLSVDQNPLGSKARDAVVTISTSSLTKTVKIHQAAGETPVLNVIPSTLGTLEYENVESTQSFTIKSNIEWSVTCSDESWCHIVSPTSAVTGNGEVKIKVDVNPAEAPERTCTLRIKSSWFEDKIVTVHQKKGDAGYVRVSNSSLSAKPQGETLTYNIESNLSSWTVSSNQGWCEVKTTSGSFNGTVSLSVGLNSGSEAREATITIKSAISDVTVTIHQEPKAVPGGDDNPDPSYSRKR